MTESPLPPSVVSNAARVPWIAVVVFVVVSFGLAWLATLPLWFSGQGLADPLLVPLSVAMMYTPTIATLVAILLLRSPGTDRLRSLGIVPLRPLGRWFRMLGIALGGTIGIVLVTTAVSAALGLFRIDLTSSSAFGLQIAALIPEGTPMPPYEVLLISQLVVIPLGAVINSIAAFGEELGWRGWLLPSLRPLGTAPALVISGAIWGLWHSPLILLGYNFGRTDLTGVLFMTGGCIAWGVVLGWLRLRSRSLWPAVLAHGTLNAAGGLVMIVTAVSPTPDLALVGPLGVVAWAVIAVVVVAGLAIRGTRRT